MTRARDSQTTLFELPRRKVEASPARPEHLQLAAALPPSVRLGAMTWSYRGWIGSVYASDVSEQELARNGLPAYARHPLLGLAELDRTYYEPLSVEQYQQYARQVPDGFGFLVKTHELCTVERFPTHTRYGDKRGQDNPLFLDPDYASRRVVEPAVEGLGDRLLALLWQFSPHDARDPEDRRRFVAKLHEFLRRLPSGCRYAVELRNRELLEPEYAAVLADTGANHCYNAWTFMPSVLEQARSTPPSARRPLIIRWLLRPGERFEAARKRFEPFDHLVAEDAQTRGQIVDLVARAHAHGVSAYILVDNKAEGHAPESIARLAAALAARLGTEPK